MAVKIDRNCKQGKHCLPGIFFLAGIFFAYYSGYFLSFLPKKIKHPSKNNKIKEIANRYKCPPYSDIINNNNDVEIDNNLIFEIIIIKGWG